MKFTKKNLFAIGGAVMMTASLASFASASIPAPASIPVHSDLSGVEVVDVDLSAMDFSEMLERLSDSFANQTQFSANVAHELKTPLATMQASGQVLRMDEAPTGRTASKCWTWWSAARRGCGP